MIFVLLCAARHSIFGGWRTRIAIAEPKGHFMQKGKRLIQWSFVSFISVAAVFYSPAVTHAKQLLQQNAGPSDSATHRNGCTSCHGCIHRNGCTQLHQPHQLQRLNPRRCRCRSHQSRSSTPFTDSDGNVGFPDQGLPMATSRTVPDEMQSPITKDPAPPRTERYSMSSFSYPGAPTEITVKLHFAETMRESAGGGRGVSFNVEARSSRI